METHTHTHTHTHTQTKIKQIPKAILGKNSNARDNTMPDFKF
jgi:hypothetical protein